MGQKKYRKPRGYEPPMSAEELLNRYETGERFFAGAQLSETTALAGHALENVNLSCADLTGAYAADARFFGVDFAHARGNGMTLMRAQLYRCNFAHAYLNDVHLYQTQMAFVSFFAAEMNDPRFLECLVVRDEDLARVVPKVREVESCFVSYSTLDPFADDVAQELLRAEIPHWFMPRSSWFDSSLSENLVRAVEDCDVFVLLLSEAALASRWVAEEVAAAGRLHRRTGAPRSVTLRVDPTEVPATGPFSALARGEVMDASGSDRARRLDDLIAQFRTPDDRGASR
jgi:hypothetical protein